MVRCSSFGKALLVGGLAVLALAQSASAAGSLVSSLEAVNGSVAAQDDILVRWSLTNNGSSTAYVLRYQTPLFGVESNLFVVALDGERVPYNGKLVKRAAPTAKDFLAVAPGETLSKVVELSSIYDFARAGEYSVQYRINLGETLRPAKLGSSQPYREDVLSNEVAIWREVGAVADDNHLLEEQGRLDQPSLALRALTPSYISCSSSRQSALVTALSSAQSYASNASSYMNAGTVGARYTTWFGSYTSSRYSTVRTHYSTILSTIQNQRITFNCSCTDSSYAYVFPGSPYTIYLCNAFWAAPNTGTDSRAGTLIHELSHFYVVASTDDWAYGQTACRSLATSNPSRAIDNADSHEYFAENNPFQN
ncbi:MAG: M35 family metallo-endopeptidase [Thermoanaerobaculia bacterium]